MLEVIVKDLENLLNQASESDVERQAVQDELTFVSFPWGVGSSHRSIQQSSMINRRAV